MADDGRDGHEDMSRDGSNVDEQEVAAGMESGEEEEEEYMEQQGVAELQSEGGEQEEEEEDHLRDVVSQVTVKALREFSTGDMQQPQDAPVVSRHGSQEQMAGRQHSAGSVRSGSREQVASRGSIRSGGSVRSSGTLRSGAGSRDQIAAGGGDDDNVRNVVGGEDEVTEFPSADAQDRMVCELDEEGEEDEEGYDGEDRQEDEGLDDGTQELVVLDPDHPLMKRFQQALRTLLSKQLDKLKLDIKETMTALHKKQKEREDVGVELYGVQYELAHYQKTLEALQDEVSKAKQCREIVEQNLAEVRKLYNDKQQQTAAERKKGAELRAELENINLRLFYLENAKEDVRSDIAVMKRAAEKAESEVIKAEQTKRKQDLFVNRLVERLDQLREDIALYDVQLEAQTAETRAAREALTEAKMEIESITVEKKQLYAAWNSALVGMRRRDEAHAAMTEALHEQQQRLLTIETEIDGFRRLIQKEQQENEKLTLTLNKAEGEIATVKRMLANCQAKFEALKEEYAKYTRVLHETEESLGRINVEKAHCTTQLNEIRKEIERNYFEKVRLEDDILEKLRDQLTADKAAQYTQKIIRQLRERTKDLETQVASAENDIAKNMLEATQIHTEIDMLEKKKAELDAEMKSKDEIVAKSQTEITRRNVEIKRKQDQLQQLNAEFDKLVLAAGGTELGPLEIQINSLRKSIEAESQAISELQQSWLRDQGELVRLSQEHDKQSTEVELMIKQHTILTQKKLRIESEITSHLAETAEVEKEIHHLQIDLRKLDMLLHRERGNEDSLQQDNLLLESQFMGALKAAERESIELQDKLESMKEEKERLLNSLIEAERQIMLWEKKTQLAKETRAAVDADIGQGEISAMRNEIHRMEVRYSQLMKQQEKMIQDMEKAVSRRDTIVTRGEAQARNTNKKIATKSSIHRELSELKHKIKQTQQEAGECDGEIQQLKQQQQQLSLQLDDKQVHVQQLQSTMDSLDADVDQLLDQKQVNITDLIARQQKTKYYQQLKDGKYTRLCKTATSLDAEKQRQHDRMNEILAIVDRLCNEFPQTQQALHKVVVAYGSRVPDIAD